VIFLFFTACESNMTGEDEVDDLSCNVNSFSAVGDYIASWEICEMDDDDFDLHNRVILSTLNESIQVQVSDDEYDSYSPIIWTSGNNLKIVYGKSTSGTQGSQFFINQIILKTYTLDGEFVSEETLMEVEPGRYGTFQIPFRMIERGPNSTLVYWADNEAEGVARAANIFEIENGKVSGNRYLTGVRSVNTPHAIMDGEYYIFAFMSTLTPGEIQERELNTDQNSIFIVKSDKHFQSIGEEKVVNVGGGSDWGVSPTVENFDEKYAVVFRSANQPSNTLDRLNLRIYDPEAEKVTHSAVWDSYTYLNHQILTDSEGNLMIFYIESDDGIASDEYNLRIKTIKSGTYDIDDQLIRAVKNPNFQIERLDQNRIRLYYGEASDRIVSAEYSLNSIGS
jgi:hypothetical protein